ncbi:MAG: hypothetical protein KME56_08330 [Candidatus Thiodiazotropha sp. (ex Ctena orbiculata)]|uniref:P-II family nitrogen regulator n=1 Tax=Candidatus Thiodiazotropha taylori TaxID=2792791 RepID=A0A944QUG0_9GAMM|nr:hypothetical protein [Candidatus Thiodiazotropha taylori]MBV2093770.1 hypothetical protein [Candidatus Thiodiazotropha sp. (ex Codakia orbicularis)]PUB71833.1 MAG: hypothetical protein DBP03_20105 [gamma proteobacterium symbiont of Ctena orbiculata]MBT2991038.1 hypothetical protein [Candidatus Thiodiazotropha taylori]MBT2996624.1 hypothetical protein [Candidatus Thiodiazotropha taylori]
MLSAMQQQKVITCVLPKGKAGPVLEVLARERKLTAVDIHFARGIGRITPLRHRGIGETSEREVLTVAVAAAEADEMFEYIHGLAEIDRPHGGLMYMHDLQISTGFSLPTDLNEEE